jgi:phenylalanyl-tRNA synthetase beta chain
VILRVPEVHRILGEKLGTEEILRILRALGFDLIPEPSAETDFTVQIPSWRLDVEREIDLIEEIARLHGYDKFPNTLPAFAGAVKNTTNAQKDAKLRTSLLALGYNEAISPTFISHWDAEHFSNAPVVELANPLSEEASVMRNSLVPGMLDMLAYNLNRGNEDVRLFEAGNIFADSRERPIETKHICIGATGNAVPATLDVKARAFSFFDLKGDIEILLQAFHYGVLAYDRETSEYYRAGYSARALMDGETVAQFGQLASDTNAGRKLRQEVFIGELYLDKLYAHELRQPRFQALPRYPAVERDFSFIFSDAVTFDKIEHAVKSLHLKELCSFIPVEIFRGGSISRGEYSLLLRATFQSNERTLREEEVAQWSTEIVKTLEGLGGKQRA